MWILRQSMMEQPVMGRKLRPLPATLNHAVTITLETKVRDKTMKLENVVIFLTQQLTANGVNGVNVIEYAMGDSRHGIVRVLDLKTEENVQGRH